MLHASSGELASSWMAALRPSCSDQAGGVELVEKGAADRADVRCGAPAAFSDHLVVAMRSVDLPMRVPKRGEGIGRVSTCEWARAAVQEPGVVELMVELDVLGEQARQLARELTRTTRDGSLHRTPLRAFVPVRSGLRGLL